MDGGRMRQVLVVLAAAGVFLAACSSGGTDGAAVREAVPVGSASTASSGPSAPSELPRTSPSATTTSDPSGTSGSVPSTPSDPQGSSQEPTAASNPAGTDPAPTSLPDVGLPGVNVIGCVSDLPPVLLLHGTLSTIAIDYPAMASALTAAGRCVYGADYGLYGTQAVRTSATAFAAFVAAVRADTGAAQVDVVGFSQGGLVLRTALREDGLADVVRVAVLISPSFHGTTSRLVTLPGAACPACADQAAGSALLTALDAGGDLDGAVRYAVAVTAADQIVTPWESQIPAGPADRVRSVVLDQRCPATSIRHQDMSRDPGVVGWAVLALGNGGAIDADDLVCTPGTG